jgi:hypothetical protein
MSRRPVLAVLAVFLFIAPAALAQTNATGEQIYRLAPESAFEEGCFDPCMCIAHYSDRLLGTMTLTPGVPEPGFTVYDVRQVNWLVPQLEHWVTGSGTYRIGGQPLVHRLVLDLEVDDRGVQRFDSGLVPVTSPLPEIAIMVSMNNLVCHDTVFRLVARPVSPREIAPYALYRSAYEEGCFGPCLCAVVSRPLAGRFGLLKLGGNENTEFAVLGFRARVRDSNATLTSGVAVTGFGIYRVGLDTAANAVGQRMRLALTEDGRGPTRFDSGVVPWDGNLRHVDVDVAANGFACFDRVYSLHARQRSQAVVDFQVISPDPVDPVVEPVP